MKNFSKLLGIIAMVAVIGLLFSCGTDPEDQILITITGLPTGAEGSYAIMGLYDNISGSGANAVASATAPKRISGGSVTNEMSDSAGAAFDKDGAYYIVLIIFAEESMTTTQYTGYTTAAKAVAKGENSYPVTAFYPDILSVFSDEPSSSEYGTYEGGAADAANKEVIALTKTSLTITEKVISTDTATGDNLSFTITKWEDATPSKALIDAGYVNGFKFTGKITAQTGYVPSNKTAPNFTAADVNNTECWMFIYFKGTAPNITFVRTPFSKTGNVNTGIVTSDSGANRVYTKK